MSVTFDADQIAYRVERKGSKDLADLRASASRARALLAGGAAARALARRAGDGEAHVLGVPDGGMAGCRTTRASPS